MPNSDNEMYNTNDVYEGMRYIRDDFNCIDEKNFAIPTLEEMFANDIIEERLTDKDKRLRGKNDAAKAAFYSKGPVTTELGYHEMDGEGYFVLKVNAASIPDCYYNLNRIDGDTIEFPSSDIDDGGNKPFTKDGKTYQSFKDYCNKNGGGNKVTIRSAHINCPEIPHVEVQAIPKNTKYDVMTYKEAQSLYDNPNNEVYMIKAPTTKDKRSLRQRDPNEKVSFYKYESKEGKTIYREIVTKDFPYDGAVLEENKNPNYKYETVVTTDESTKEGVLGGYRAQRIVKDAMQNSTQNSDVYLVLDANTVTGGKTGQSGKTFNNWFFAPDVVDRLIGDWNTALSDVPINKMTYSPYGQDKYGRFLGTVFIRKNTDNSWVNLSKLVLASDTGTQAQPNYSGSEEIQSVGGDLSAALEGDTYDPSNYKFVDIYASMEKEYNDKIKFHEKVTGMNFKKYEDCTVMLGDTMFMVPPTSIRNVSSVSYERKDILRGKGSMSKEGNREQMMEMDLYFYDDLGINGIPVETELPNKKKVTYYMNGLRSLIAQFKVAPFLPIENGYINDILCIEAVTLESINITTVEGTPRLLRVVLTLRDFNYRVYMPEIPVDVSDYQRKMKVEDVEEYKGNSEDGPFNKRVTEEDGEKEKPFVNMFARVFDWELFRFHYQKAILKGETASNLKYGDEGYIDLIYDNKNVLQKNNVCDSTVGFFVPSNAWLEKALKIKKERDRDKTSLIEGSPLDENGRKYMDSLNGLCKIFDDMSKKDKEKPYVESYLNGLANFISKKPYLTSYGKVEDLANGGKTNLRTWSGLGGTFSGVIAPVFEAPMNEVSNLPCVKKVTLDETSTPGNGGKATLVYTMNIHLNFDKLSDEQEQAVKQSIKTSGKDKNGNFEKDVLKVNFEMPIDENGYVIPGADGTTKGTDFMTIKTDDGYQILKNIKTSLDPNANNESTEENQDSELAKKYQDYKDPKAMEFVPYLENVIANGMSVTMSNTFTQMYLKSLDGYAPQYMGAQDTAIELRFTTDDMVVVSLLNNLASFSASTQKKYRRILPSWPLRVKNSMLQMLGINEVVIEQSDVQTVEEAPGVFRIMLRLISIDRTMREREALQKVGQGTTTDNTQYRIKQFFDLDKSLSKVDVYPDLDLPTLKELSDYGFEFAKYYVNNANDRAFPDPDFYIIYSFMYTAALIKNVLKDALSKALYSDKAPKENFSQHMEDFLGMQIETTLNVPENESGGKKGDPETKIKWENDMAKAYREMEEAATKEAKGKATRFGTSDYGLGYRMSQNEGLENYINKMDILTYLIACDVQKGWTIKNGWMATKCEDYTNRAIKEFFNPDGKYFKDQEDEEMEKTEEEKKEEQEQIEESGEKPVSADEKKKMRNAYAKKIINLRQKAILLIDRMLDKPIVFRMGKRNTSEGNSDYIDAVNYIFNNEDGEEFVKLFCPIGEQASALKDFDFSEKNFSSVDDDGGNITKELFLRYIAGFLYASACALSGETTYGLNKNIVDWSPRQFVKNAKGDMIYHALTKTEVGHLKAQTNYSAKHDGVALGAFMIRRYSRDELLRMFKHKPVSGRLMGDDPEHATMYPPKDGKKLLYNDGFLDRYYNGFDWYTSSMGTQYREAVLNSEYNGAVAFLRIMLMHLRRLILEGVMFSEIDILAADFDNMKKDFSGAGGYGNTLKTIIPTRAEGIGALHTNPRYKPDGQLDENSGIGDDEVTEEDKYERLEDMINKVIDDMPLAYVKSFTSRMIYPFIMAVSDADPAVVEYIKDDDTSGLDALTASSLTGQSKNSALDRFLAACVGANMFPTIRKEDDNETSMAQDIVNSMMKNIYISASKDPRQYVLHSFYNMLVNDKRGRLVRAFPTYYMMFIDEGREIGVWRLFDNFYSMSAISDINIVKSRKNPTDVCTFSMNNMFDSYAATYSDATTQQYTDVYGIKDTFNSIFSPREYLEKEEIMRKRFVLPDTNVLKPGVRIHMRIGYGSDASLLPIGFNGKIAEINVDSVVDVVAQGDGHELTNPLNALGEVEAKSLEEAQETVTWFKDIRGSMARGGLTPRDLMANILSAKHGGIIKTRIRNISDKQFFNENPFGISHFGDHKFTQIFEDGESVQNLFEVTYEGDTKDVLDLLWKRVGHHTPTINTTLHDKTAWGILELCANSGLDYYGAIRDFGVRSTVFLGKPNDYIAWKYAKFDGKIVERRKPFQQFHYFNSYTDIIYNNISASEATMKTNAVGTWQSTDYIWGKSQDTVGPIYLDMNIYPENQKSMTVDTGLIAAGNGGIDLPLTTRLMENFTMTANDAMVNKSLVEQVTTSCLKNSVKDMYEGEICVIGDPSIDVYDRVSISDTYEDMNGTVEVESVIYSMNSQTGFTTTIKPDVIVKQVGSDEMQRLDLEKHFVSALSIGITTRLASNLYFADTDAKVMKAIARDRALNGTTPRTIRGMQAAIQATGIEKYVTPDAEGNVTSPKLKSLIDKISNASPYTDARGVFVRQGNRIKGLNEMLEGLGDEPTLSDIKRLINLNNVDLDDYKKQLNKIKGMENLDKETLDKINTQIGVIDELNNQAGGNIKNWGTSALDEDFFKGFNKNMADAIKNDPKLNKLGEKLVEMNGETDLTKKNKIFREIINDPIFDDIVKNSDELEKLMLGLGGKEGKLTKGLLNNKMLKEGLKRIDPFDEKLLGKAFKYSTRLTPGTIFLQIAKALATVCITGTIRAMFTRWCKNIQALAVYPVDKSMRPLTAGMNGYKGSVMSYPPPDPYNSIQGMVMQALDKFNALPVIGGFVRDTFLIGSEDYEEIFGNYKKSLGIGNTEYTKGSAVENEELKKDVMDNLSHVLAQKTYNVQAASARSRLQSYNTDKGSIPEYKKHAIIGQTKASISRNQKVKDLMPIEDDPMIKKAVNGNHGNVRKLEIAHSKSKYSVQIDFESGFRRIKYLQGPGSKVYDMPILKEDALIVLKSILESTELEGKTVFFTSGTRVNSTKTWQNTGFRFVLKCNENEKLLSAVKKVKNDTMFLDQMLFNYKEQDGSISICVYPPKEKKNK